jgi:hypothetical protein
LFSVKTFSDEMEGHPKEEDERRDLPPGGERRDEHGGLISPSPTPLPWKGEEALEHPLIEGRIAAVG